MWYNSKAISKNPVFQRQQAAFAEVLPRSSALVIGFAKIEVRLSLM